MSETLTLGSNPKSASGGGAAPAADAAKLFAWSDRFVRRHIGPQEDEISKMLEVCGFKTIEALIDTAVPSKIRFDRPLNLPPSRSEYGLLGELRKIAGQNRLLRSFIGMGYHDCITPPVIQRN